MRGVWQVATLTVGTLAAVAIVYLPNTDTEPVPPTTTFVTAAEVFATAAATTPSDPPTTPPETSTTTTAPVMPPSTVTAPTAPTTTLVPPDALCGMWWVTAIGAGWDADDLPTLDRVLYNESRCIPGLTSSTGDIGLAQLNVATWSHLWEANGHETWQVADSPSLNLIYARQVADAAEALGWCEWAPWHGFSGDYC